MNKAPEKKASIWSAAFITLIVANLFQYMGQMMSFALVPLFAYDMGASAGMVGIITGAFAITALAARPFAGPAIDSFSRKWLFVFAMCLYVVAMFGYSIVNSIPGLFGMRLIHGLAMALSGPLGLTLAVQMLPVERISSGVGFYTLAQVLGQALGPAFGIWLSTTFDYATAFRFCFVCVAIAVVLLVFMKVPNEPERKPYKLSLNRMFCKEAVMPTVLLFLLSMAYCSVSSFVVIYANLQGVENIGMYFTVYAVCLLGTRPIMGNLADRNGIKVVLLPCLVLYAISFALLFFANNLPLFLASAVSAACGYGAASPLLQALAMKLAPRDAQGSASNTNYTGLDAANLAGPAFSGVVIEGLQAATGNEVVAYANMWLVMIIPLIVAFAVYMVWDGKRRQQMNKDDRKTA